MSQDPMPLDPELLEMENELRTLVPLEMDFTTAQRLTRALEGEFHAGTATSGWHLLDGGTPPHPQATPPIPSLPSLSARRWWPWAAAASVGVLGVFWMKMPDGTGDLAGGGVPARAVTRGTVEQIFPTPARENPASAFGPRGTEFEAMVTDGQAPQPARRAAIPEATSPYGFLNVTVVELPEKYCREVGIPGGVWVQAMGIEGPAARQGIEVGDFILKVDGRPVRTADGFVETIRGISPGTEVSLIVRRGRITGEILVRLGAAPST
jgi:hypothetical protein